MRLRRFCAALLLGLICTLPVRNAPAADTLYAVTQLKVLLVFDTTNPQTPLRTLGLLGFQSAGEEVVSCDVRPANGVFYLITIQGLGVGRLYTANLVSGQVTLVGQISTTLSGSFFGMDFDPIADAIRLISDARENLLINPVNAVATVQGELTYAPGDIAEFSFPAAFSCAYTNNYPGAPSTNLYSLDVQHDRLIRIDPPFSGTLHSLGNLGADFGGNNAMEITGPDNRAYAAIPSGGVTRLFSINLATGAASDLGQIFQGEALAGLTSPRGFATALRPDQKVRVVAAGTWYQELFFNYTTQALFVGPVTNQNGSFGYPHPTDQWMGIFHYDYATGSFNQAIYIKKDPLL